MSGSSATKVHWSPTRARLSLGHLPDFIHLNAAAGEFAHFLVHEGCAAGPDLDHKAHHGGSDRIALDLGSDDLSAPGERQAGSSRNFSSLKYLRPQTTHRSRVNSALCPQAGYRCAMKTEIIKVRLSPKEKEGFQIAADLSGLALSAWIRERLRRAAIRELEEASRPIPFIGSGRS